VTEHAWLDFMREFEVSDPEPEMGEMEPNQTMQGFGYESERVDAHMQWHRRLTDAWKGRTI